YISAADVGQAQAKQFGYEFVDVSTVQIPAAVVQMVPESVARENLVCPISLGDDGSLTVAMHDPEKYEVLDKLRFMINREIKVVVAPKDVIQQAINRHYGQSETESVDSMIAEFTETAIDFTETELAAAAGVADDENAPVVKLVNLMLTEAVNMRASDI